MNAQDGDDSQTSQPIDDEVDRQLAEALGGQDMQQFLAGACQPPRPSDPSEDNQLKATAPERARGRISAVHQDDVFVDLHGAEGKYQGVVPLGQFERSPRIGSIMDFVVQRIDQSQGLVILSREGMANQAAWDQLCRGSVVEARVSATNKGGLELEMAGSIQAFMPASHVDLRYVDDLESFVGQKLRAHVQEINHRSKKIVLNRRSLLESERHAQQAKLWQELQVGQTRQGIVSGIRDYGAFVDLGGVDGLVHISDMSYDRIAKPADIASVGQSVTVKVLTIDPENKRIGLGIKQVQPDPWTGAQDKYKKDTLVQATVMNLADFGAFVELEHGLEGLVHISELAEHRVNHVADVLQVGQKRQFRVIDVNEQERRIRLSLKAVDASGPPEPSGDQPTKAQAIGASHDRVRPMGQRAHKKPPRPLKGGIE